MRALLFNFVAEHCISEIYVVMQISFFIGVRNTFGDLLSLFSLKKPEVSSICEDEMFGDKRNLLEGLMLFLYMGSLWKNNLLVLFTNRKSCLDINFCLAKVSQTNALRDHSQAFLQISGCKHMSVLILVHLLN